MARTCRGRRSGRWAAPPFVRPLVGIARGAAADRDGFARLRRAAGHAARDHAARDRPGAPADGATGAAGRPGRRRGAAPGGRAAAALGGALPSCRGRRACREWVRLGRAADLSLRAALPVLEAAFRGGPAVRVRFAPVASRTVLPRTETEESSSVSRRWPLKKERRLRGGGGIGVGSGVVLRPRPPRPGTTCRNTTGPSRSAARRRR